MAHDNLDYYRTVGGIALRVLPDRPDVLIMEIKTQHGPFRFGMSQDMAQKVAAQISDQAKRLKTRETRSQMTNNSGRDPAKPRFDHGDACSLGLASQACATHLEVVEHVQADRRRQIALLALSIDLAN
jgi:hypothetical protein